MSTPNNRRVYVDTLQTNAAALSISELLQRSWDEPSKYTLRLVARVYGGPSDLGVSVLFRLYVNDGLGDGEHIIDTTVVTAASDADSGVDLSDGIALSHVSRLEIIPATPLAALSRRVMFAAAIAPAL